SVKFPAPSAQTRHEPRPEAAACCVVSSVALNPPQSTQPGPGGASKPSRRSGGEAADASAEPSRAPPSVRGALASVVSTTFPAENPSSEVVRTQPVENNTANPSTRANARRTE